MGEFLEGTAEGMALAIMLAALVLWLNIGEMLLG
jgi:hypothetical protein